MVGWEILLNLRETTWRKVPKEVRDSIDESSAIDLILKTLSRIKRHVLKIENHIEVKLKQDEYATLF